MRKVTDGLNSWMGGCSCPLRLAKIADARKVTEAHRTHPQALSARSAANKSGELIKGGGP